MDHKDGGSSQNVGGPSRYQNCFDFPSHISHVFFLQLLRIRSPTPFPIPLPVTWSSKTLRPIWIPWRRCSSRNRKWWMVWTRPPRRNCQTKVLFTLLFWIKSNWTKVDVYKNVRRWEQSLIKEQSSEMSRNGNVKRATNFNLLLLSASMWHRYFMLEGGVYTTWTRIYIEFLEIGYCLRKSENKVKFKVRGKLRLRCWRMCSLFWLKLLQPICQASSF